MNSTLVAASLTDKVKDGLSGIYKFFTPDRSKHSLGSWIIDWHIEETIRLKLKYVYLGYWIKESSKMSYKSKFKGLENEVVILVIPNLKSLEASYTRSPLGLAYVGFTIAKSLLYIISDKEVAKLTKWKT